MRNYTKQATSIFKYLFHWKDDKEDGTIEEQESLLTIEYDHEPDVNATTCEIIACEQDELPTELEDVAIEEFISNIHNIERDYYYDYYL